MADNHVQLLAEWNIPIWSNGYWGYRFAGITGGLLADLLAEGAATGLAGSWLVPFRPGEYLWDIPADSISQLGNDALLPVYPGEEPHTEARPRIQSKWTTWTGGPKAQMIAELAVAGYGVGAPSTVLVPGDFAVPPDLLDYWSRFWIVLNLGEHPITGPGTPWVGYLVGTTRLGPDGGTAEYFSLLRSIVRRIKPVQWIPWEYQFVTSTGQISIQGTVRPLDPAYDYSSP